jgi:hypothetical protein
MCVVLRWAARSRSLHGFTNLRPELDDETTATMLLSADILNFPLPPRKSAATHIIPVGHESSLMSSSVTDSTHGICENIQE